MIPNPEPGLPDRPCLALMGEFSAGKSTLANLLIGSTPLPVQVIATQLPPVCISHGRRPAYGVGMDGTSVSLDIPTLGPESVSDLAYIRIFHDSQILEHCDLLDMPGLSDPNMPDKIWQRAIGMADGVLWCSHATQAWRQSEAAAWEELPRKLYDKSLLLLTRFDKLRDPDDKDRVLKRVRKETKGLFRDVLPISLIDAGLEDEDDARWRESGAEALAARVAALLAILNGAAEEETPEPPMATETTENGFATQSESPDTTSEPEPPRIIPRRVNPQKPTGAQSMAV